MDIVYELFIPYKIVRMLNYKHFNEFLFVFRVSPDCIDTPLFRRVGTGEGNKTISEETLKHFGSIHVNICLNILIVYTSFGIKIIYT